MAFIGIFKCVNGLIDFDFKLTNKNLYLPKINTNWGK